MYEEDIYDSNTLSGWIIEIHEKVPSVNEIVRFKNLEIEILEADERKIEWVQIREIENEENEESDN